MNLKENMKPVVTFLRAKKSTLVSILVVVPIGFFTKFYAGPAQFWVQTSLGGILYEIFWCLIFFLFWKGGKPWVIALVVLVGTSALEVLQLWNPPVLSMLRSYFLGRTILGTSFTWTDFPHYFVGCVVGWLWIRWIGSDDENVE